MSIRNDRVNQQADSDSYHHGDLRSALIDEGLAQLGDRAAEKISLREIARNVGVSATAVYRHFPSKAAFMGALCEVGSSKLAQTFRTALSETEGKMEGFEAMGRAYVHFALENPALFRLMMTKPPKSDSSTPDPDDKSNGFGMLADALQDVLPANAPPQVQMVKRLQAWSIVHGLAMLMLDGQVPAEDRIISAVVSRSFL